MAFESAEFYDNVANEALTRYDFTKGCSPRMLQLSENITYLIKNQQTGFKSILRISRPGYNNVSAINAELSWLNEIIKTTDIIVARPYIGVNGAYVQEIECEGINGAFHCVMFEFLDGEAPDENDEKNIAKHFISLGNVTAKLHKQARAWEGASKLDRPVWDYETMIGSISRWGHWQAARDMTPEIEKTLNKASEIIKKRLDAYGSSDEKFGLIHADLRLANLIIRDGKLKVIDFDDCAFGWFMHDLAAAVSFIEHKEITPSLVEAWIEGYSQSSLLKKEDLTEVDTFIMQRRLQLLAWLASHYDSDPVKELSKGFTEGTVILAEKYLSKFS
jgi:Ser/Thr protein kinase RdoA (MazF antagonist)